MNRYVEAHPEIHLPPAPAQGTVPRWTSLSWTPFNVRHAPGAGEAANAVALAVHRARDVLARRIGISMPVRVLVVDGADDGIRTLQPESTLWMPAEVGPGWSELARMLDDRLPHRSRLLLRRTVGRAAGPLELAPVSYTHLTLPTNREV